MTYPPAESLPLTSCACGNLPRKHIASQALGRVRVGVRVGVRDRDRVRVRLGVRVWLGVRVRLGVKG